MLLRLPPHRLARRVLHLEPIRRAAGAIGRSPRRRIVSASARCVLAILAAASTAAMAERNSIDQVGGPFEERRRGTWTEGARSMVYLQRLAAFMNGRMSAGTAAWAQNSTVNKTPGHMMQDPKARDTGPGASEYAPGHLKRKSSASQSTPSHRPTTPTTTGSGSRTR